MMASRIKFEFNNELTEDGEILHDVFKKNGIEGIQKYIKDGLNKWRETELHIAVTGKSGAGKSTFINVIRGFKTGEMEAADTDVIECTKSIQSYTHPKNEKIVFWDLPGIGTKNFKREEYIDKIYLPKYDLFLLFSSERFLENDGWLAREIQKMGKKFYFVRSKVSCDISNDEEGREGARGSDEILEIIRNDCLRNLESYGISDCFVYLIDNFKTDDYDFNKLQSNLIEDLPQQKREAIVFSIIGKTDDLMLQKKKELEKRIPRISLISALSSTIPVPMFNTVVDFALMLKEVDFYRDQFGLSKAAIKRTAHMLGMHEEELRIDLKMKELLIDHTVKGLMAVCQTLAIREAVEEIAKFMLPILGSVAAGAISYKSTHYWMTKILEGLYQDALEINKKLKSKSEKDAAAQTQIKRMTEETVKVHKVKGRIAEEKQESIESKSEKDATSQTQIKRKREETVKVPKVKGRVAEEKQESIALDIRERGDDDEELDLFLCSGKVKNIKTLIESGRLPRQRILNEMCQIFGRKSKAIIVTCKAICEYIKSKHVAIAYVWAAYTIQDPQKITFVITMEHKSEGNKSKELVRLEKLIQYSFVKQYAGDFSLEGSEVIKQQASHAAKLDEESYKNLQTCISKNSEDLMKKHKYLSIISACSNRSKGFGAAWELLPEKCIVLYVQKKNYIPIDEEPFETSYDSIPVDVREGVFIPYVHTAGEKLNPVRMGCQIGGDSIPGTLGCFIDHPQYGVCGLTCAHVLLHSLKLERLKSYGMMKWPLHGMSTNVYQPFDNQSVLGNVVQLICKKGSGNTCGMDVALFRITDRQPKTASFPDATAISGSSFQTINYDSWRMCGTGMLDLTQARVVKFGSSTELRDGKIKFDAMGVKQLDCCPLFLGCATITLFRQIEVENYTPGPPFAAPGDSGALVFVVDNNTQHTCIGIVEGGTTYGTVVVTPIVPILDELNVPGLKSFEKETTLSHIDDNINNLQGEMQTVRQDIQNINRNLQDVRSSIQDVQTQSSTIQRIEQLLLNRR